MSELFHILVPVKEFSEVGDWIEGNKKWVKIYPYSTWHHPQFGETTVDEEIASKFVRNFNDRVRGIDIVVSYDHGLDPAKGGKAAGWYRTLEQRPDGLYGLVEFTDTAKAEITAGEWRYFSGEHRDHWTHPQTKESHDFVIEGGALTNKCWIKDGMLPLNFSEIYVEREADTTGRVESGGIVDPQGEHADIEHSEPGVTEPRTDERNDDDSADSGSRIDTPPDADIKDEGGEVNETDKRLREILGLSEDSDIIKAVTDLSAEVAPLREAAKAHSEKKAFAELFPNEARELAEARTERIETRAKAFSERYERITDKEGKPTNKGFPAVVRNKLEEVHKRFSEGSANIGDVQEILDLVGTTGLVDYSERGSRTEDDTDFANDSSKSGTQKFSETVAEIQDADKLPYEKAVLAAAERHPDLYEAYRRESRPRR